jgi:hypothetical protein
VTGRYEDAQRCTEADPDMIRFHARRKNLRCAGYAGFVRGLNPQYCQLPAASCQLPAASCQHLRRRSCFHHCHTIERLYSHAAIAPRDDSFLSSYSKILAILASLPTSFPCFVLILFWLSRCPQSSNSPSTYVPAEPVDRPYEDAQKRRIDPAM